MRVLFALRRVGPYHRARLIAAVEAGLELSVLQTRPQSQEYSWIFDPAGPYSLTDLSGATGAESDPPLACLDCQLEALLDRSSPAVIVSVGWADRAYQRLLLLAHRRRIPLVIVSDSRHRDEPRWMFKEWLKSQLLRGYAAALVAGIESRAYMETLGFPALAIHQPWDVVDNALFAKVVQQVRTSQPHFLCVARLVAKKNHQGLLGAYAMYQRQGGRWGLHLVGSGPLLHDIQAQVAALPDPLRVHLSPFSQVDELVHVYDRANCFLLASTTDQWGLVVNEAMAAGLPCLVSSGCGSALDLIEHGVSGWCFDPSNTVALAALMLKAERQPAQERAAMVVAARRRLEEFSPERFATGLHQAVEWALAHPRYSRRAALTAWALSLQP